METERQAALVLSPEPPYPLVGGGALRTASLLNHLARNREVDVILFRQPGAADPAGELPAGLIRRVSIIHLPVNGRSLPARASRNAARMARRVPPLVDRFAGFEEEVTRAIGGTRYGVGVIEHSWCAAYWQELSPVCARTVLDLHNIESVLHERCAAVEHTAAALAHRVFRAASVECERTWLPRFSEVLTASESDAELARAIAPAARIMVYPNAIPAAALPPQCDDEAVVFSGNMEYHPNRGAVRFFHREVWPRLRERWPGLVWRLVGKNAEAVSRFTSSDPRIDVRNHVEDAVAELARARVAVVPVLAGSGTRVKILEAWAAGLPVVSTTLGAEGLPAKHGEHLLLADGAAPFADAVSRLLESRDLRLTLGAAGRRLVEREFTWEAAWRRLDF